MDSKERIQMLEDVFAPKKGERVLFLVDLPHDEIEDNDEWQARRQMADEWRGDFGKMAETAQFTVDKIEFPATGKNNAKVPGHIIDEARKSNLVIAMTEYSATAPLGGVCDEEGSITRCASMPGVAKGMEETALRADYKKVKMYALALTDMLNNSVGARISFSTGDSLYLDLRGRVAEADTGECSQAGQCINFPAGESFKVPYEAVEDEVGEYGPSKSSGIMPVDYDGDLVKFVIKNNRVVDVEGDGPKAVEMKEFFAQNDSRRNLAELGLGCNPKAVVSGNVLEDEKVGLHIAYGLSEHLGGKVDSDLHEDIVYAKGCPVEGETLILLDKDGSETELILQSQLRYDLLIKG
jgi:leucyl aminopeptidase (aminopeptidase T)